MKNNHLPLFFAFKGMFQDLEETIRYVHPHQDNLSVYSDKFYNLFLRACTEFESSCKEVLLAQNLTNKLAKDLNIKDYFTLSSVLGLEQIEIGFRFFSPETYYSKPFNGWTQNTSLQWYRDYNQVKHNRETKFELANFKNVLDAIAAIFVLVTQLNAYMTEDEFNYTNSASLHTVIEFKDGFSYNYDVRWPASICRRYKT